MRIVVLATVLGGVMLISVSAAIVWPPVLIWNASASVPIGLYYVKPEERLEVTDLVVVTPPEPVARFLAERDCQWRRQIVPNSVVKVYRSG